MVQIRLWQDCYNNCIFCSLGQKSITPLEIKKIRLKKLLTIPRVKRYGIIGGEFFEGQLHGCEQEWLDAIKNLPCDELFITANLINNQYLLEETLKIRSDILICTSYDTVGRFKSDADKLIWLDRVKKFNGKVSCTLILTQDIFTDKFISDLPQYCNMNLSEPFLGIEWYYKINKQEYHSQLLKDNKLFNLPKRKDFLKWIINPLYETIRYNMQNYKKNHFDTMLYFNDNNDIYYYNRFEDQNFLAKCGHPYLSKCYADSDKCVACDIENLS